MAKKDAGNIYPKMAQKLDLAAGVGNGWMGGEGG